MTLIHTIIIAALLVTAYMSGRMRGWRKAWEEAAAVHESVVAGDPPPDTLFVAYVLSRWHEANDPCITGCIGYYPVFQSREHLVACMKNDGARAALGLPPVGPDGDLFPISEGSL